MEKLSRVCRRILGKRSSLKGVFQKYRKVHLFDAPVVGLKESNWTLAGEKLSEIIPSPVGNLALSICYDLRFPHLSHEYRRRGANVLTFPR